ncbi:MAG: Asp-tRNA(Asn)/Glu-tRNA(Gln) amidotransferase subunit GatA [Bacillota bacterium]
MEITELGLKELRDKIVDGELTPSGVLDAYRERIESVEDQIKAYVTLTDEKAGEMQADIDPEATELAGIPIAVKDNMSTAGVRTTCSSKMLEDYVPPFDATAVKKLKEAGGTILGKTNMDEYAMGSSTENSAFFPSHNPWNPKHVTGGSSGGSAAAVAAGECPAALGSDTGGSIRQPAAFCGVFGLKPTYGLVSRYGLIAYASSLDQIGPITRNVEDAALLLNAISGHDPMDSTSVDRDYPDYTQFLKDDVEDIKIGLPSGYFNLDFDSEVKNSVLAAVEKLEAAGATVEEVELTEAEFALAAYYIIAPAEASSNLARYDGVRYGHRSEKTDNVKTMFTATRNEGFGDEVKRRIMLGTYALSSGYYDDFYLKAQKVRTLIMEDYRELFEEYDVLITPTTPTTAFKIGEKKDPLEMYHADIFTVPINIAGIPAASIPCGFDDSGLPIGLQILGPHFGEGKILQTAYSLEQILDLGDRRPEL